MKRILPKGLIRRPSESSFLPPLFFTPAILADRRSDGFRRKQPRPNRPVTRGHFISRVGALHDRQLCRPIN